MRRNSGLSRIFAAFLAGFAAIGATAGPLAPWDPYPEGYTCCNLHYDRDWISDANWSTFPMIPAGARIKVTSYGSNRASVEIDGKNFRIGQDYGRGDESLESFIGKLILKENPRDRIAAYPEGIREAIRLGKVVPGMSRDQALIAAGHPPTHQTKILDAPVWSYWNDRFSRWTVTWDGNGTVREVAGQR